MKNKLKLMFCFICLWAVFAAPTAAQGIGERNRAADGNNGRHTIQGRVFLPDGTPARNVRVSITSADSLSTSAMTNDEGVFQSGSVSAGNYTIAVKVEGLQQQNEYLMIPMDEPQGRTFNVVLYLRAPGQSQRDVSAVNVFYKGVPKGALEKFKKAMDKMHSNDPKGAITLFDASISEHPTFALALYERGTAYLTQNNLDKALESFVGAVQAKSDYLEAKYYVGYTQYLRNNFEVAAAIFEDVLQQSDLPEAHLYLGISLVKLRELDRSIPHFKAAISKKDDETTALAHRYLGGIYVQKKQNAEAVAELQRYLELVPKAPDADKLKATITSLKKGS